MRRPRAVLFDFDYTLADSSRAIVDCFNAGLRGIGLPEAAPDAIRQTIGLPVPDSLVAVAGLEHAARTDEFRRCWRARSDEIMVAWTEVYADAAQTIEALHRDDYLIGVVSTKYRDRIEAVLEREELLRFFSVILGGDDVEQLKPHPEGLQRAMQNLGVSPLETLYVGDSVVDAEAANRAGVPFVGVLSGVTSPDRFPAGAHLVNSLAEVAAALQPAELKAPGGPASTPSSSPHR